MTTDSIDRLDWAKGDGLLPAIVQHAADGRVLMLGYMNEAALDKTRSSGQVTFFSRSRQRLWTKGETSGHVLNLVDLLIDCDADTILVKALPEGPTCHLGTSTCFGNMTAPGAGFLSQLEAVIQQRVNAGPAESYTARLLDSGVKRCAQKVGEEGVEVALAAMAGDREELAEEAADLLYHLLVCLQAGDVRLASVIDVLRQRHQTPAG
ncbi:MAG: bifunctional phosphoribosyl-AMP cyclohydrolase/phosphoribosyl-ATP diphosphatase HisIE [Wenzhouxiangella sp.]|nr:bifunctional phosphoribosyl-AMP cyclohydrolase/phosphoribosyl-ATP diphosphatase HisIE [Wenzhouxiangella sp.]MCH8479157.1 bifunctional phosphoribosyl-AMP cyclohydrolase/phosphoribosyl-ATP diphosphatase HisIE [Wenzhouxiangella sp.]TVR93135.1 MAG: bifunctional phosphoribosyl-AMP cyclohydrolase/phosphoribosyl-ATP diphosphatase HisIE [Wenzhouxiangellaceae bacterium]